MPLHSPFTNPAIATSATRVSIRGLSSSPSTPDIQSLNWSAP